MAHRSVRRPGAGALLVALLAALPAGATIASVPVPAPGVPAEPIGAAAGHADRRPDFDGDGYADLAISAPGNDLPGDPRRVNVGAVHILYGSAAGLTAAGDQVWHLDSPGIAGIAESGDNLGRSIATHDFDDDGFTDLAVGAPLKDVRGVRDAGTVHVLYGSPAGLSARRDQVWHQDRAGVAERAERSDRFGWAMTSGDLDGDGYGDLAIAAPYEDRPGTDDDLRASNTGVVHVLYGGPNGLTAAGDELWHQARVGVPEKPDDYDSFGRAMTAGDFDGDGRDELVITAVYEDYRWDRDGLIHVLRGTAGGLSARDGEHWSQDTPGILDKAFNREQFGQSVAAGDFDGDGYDDLVAALWFQDFCYICNNGAFNVIYGSAAGLTATGDQFWHQDSPGVRDTSDPFDRFGHALAIADLDGDGLDDLAVSAPREDLFEGDVFQDQGGVNVLFGAPGGGLSGNGSQFWTQDSPGIRDATSERDLFGLSLGAADFDGNGAADLAVGIRYEDVLVDHDDGAVAVLYSRRGRGPTADADELWHQGSVGILGSPAAKDFFGWMVSSSASGSGVPGGSRPDYWPPGY